MPTVAETYTDVADFEELLDGAEQQASRGWDISFVADLKEKYEKFGSRMYISSDQIAQLERISGE